MITVKFVKTWRHREDAAGNTMTEIPKYWLGPVDDATAIAAIAEGAATPTGTLTDEQSAAVDLHKRVLDLVAEGADIDAAIEQAEEEAAAAAAVAAANAGSSRPARTRASAKK